MFKNPIAVTPFTTRAANDYFKGRITGEQYTENSTYRGDTTFLGTLRALIAPRIGENVLNLNYTMWYPANGYEGVEAVKRMFGGGRIQYIEQNHLLINELPADSKVEERLRMIDEHFTEVFQEFQKVPKVTTFFQKVFKVLCFINPNTRASVVITEPLNMRTMHYLQCGIFAFLPWYFDSKVSSEEMELLNSLREKTSEKYEACMAKLSSAYDFKTERIKRLLGEYETQFERNKIASIESEIHDLVDRLNNLEAMLSSAIKEKRAKEAELYGYRMKVTDNTAESELAEFFLSQPMLNLEDVDGDNITFTVHSPVEYWDKDGAAANINNRQSVLYTNASRSKTVTADGMHQLMTAVFLDRKIKLNFCAAYRFSGGSVCPRSGYSYGPECNGYLPNPHIDRYDCIGDYRKEIVDCLRHYDYVGAVAQCIASCQSLNFFDSTVMGEFARRLYGISDIGEEALRCFVLPDGSVVTPVEAVKYLNKNGEENNG